MVQVTSQSKVLQPVDTRAVRPGEQVIVRNAVPIGVRSTPSTKIHMGTAGKAMVLTDLRPGDQVVIVIAEDSAASTQPIGTPPAAE